MSPYHSPLPLVSLPMEVEALGNPLVVVWVAMDHRWCRVLDSHLDPNKSDKPHMYDQCLHMPRKRNGRHSQHHHTQRGRPRWQHGSLAFETRLLHNKNKNKRSSASDFGSHLLSKEIKQKKSTKSSPRNIRNSISICRPRQRRQKLDGVKIES